MSLHYVIKREETEKAVRFVAEGSEWSCNVRGEVTLSPEFPKKKFEGPEARYIGWSCGAREWTIYFRIVLPLLKPAMIAMMIFTAIGEWNNFLWPLIITQSQDMANLPVALALLKNSGAGNIGTQGVIMAAALLVSLPTIILYFLTQRHFIRGIALSGIK